MRKSPPANADFVETRSHDRGETTADQLADTLTDLARIAQDRGYEFLAYLIEMAAVEARSEAMREAEGEL